MGLVDVINNPFYYKKKITFNYLYHAMDEYKVKSIMTIPIIGISYKVKNSKKNNIRTTVCKIKWINPINGNIQCSYGNAMCNPNDVFDTTIGQQIAESRAKLNMYETYQKSLDLIIPIITSKFSSCFTKERYHLINIINKINNYG